MVIMSLDPSVNKSLIVSSVAILLFAMAGGLATFAIDFEPVSVTAGYAAVLMVFVGTSLTDYNSAS